MIGSYDWQYNQGSIKLGRLEPTVTDILGTIEVFSKHIF